MDQPQPPPPLPPNPDDENEDLDNRLHDIDIHEVDEDSTDSGEGSIIIMNEEEGHMEELVEADDGVVLDDRNSDDMETDDRDGEFHEMNGYLNEDRVGGNHPLIRFCEHTGIHLLLFCKSLSNIFLLYVDYVLLLLGSVFYCDINTKDCSLAVTGSEDDRALVWNLNTGETIFECKNHTVRLISIFQLIILTKLSTLFTPLCSL